MKNKSIATVVAVICSLLLLVLFSSWLLPWLNPGASRQPQAEIADAKLDELKRAAATATERGENFLEATSRWNELIAARPDDRSLLLNQAVTVLLWLEHTDDRMKVVASGDRSMNSRLNREQHDAYKLADRLVVLLAQLPPLKLPDENETAARQAYLESGLFEARSYEFKGEDAFKLHKLAVEKLLDHLAKDAKATFLTARSIDLMRSLESQWPEGKSRTSEATYRVWKAQPQSLYLQVQAARLLLEIQDPRLLEPLAASIEQSRKFMSGIKEADELVPQKLVETSRQAMAEGKWSQMTDVSRWLDLLIARSEFAEESQRLHPELISLLRP